MGLYTRFRTLAISGATAPTDAELAAIEKELGTPLPTDAREFLEVACGGTIEQLLDVSVPGGGMEPMCFASILFAAYLVAEIRNFRELVHLPPGVLPFATDAGGSMLFLDLSSEGGGRVVAFVHGLPAWTGLRTESSYVTVGSSLDDFVRKLYVDRDELLTTLRGASESKYVDATEEFLEITLPSWHDDIEIAEAMREARARTQ